MSLPKELGLIGQQPNIALTIFFVPYVIFEIPSNILMKRFQPHVWRMHCQEIEFMAIDLTSAVSSCITLFGVIMLCQGFGRYIRVSAAAYINAYLW
jgi:hypothetical protein